MELKEDLKKLVFEKSDLKQSVYTTTKNAFELFRNITHDLIEQFKKKAIEEGNKTIFEFKNRGDFEFEVKFAGDVLIFTMHTNVFEFSRDHEVMKTQYVREDQKRSYCGMINIYNFLADSFNYERDGDIGYMIGRIFVNYENHYFIEGKRELGLLYNNFNNAIISEESILNIIESAITYTTNFDLLTPPYDEVKLVSVAEIRSNFDLKMPITGKRLGFRFQQDTE